MQSDYDGAWKHLIEHRLREALTLYFPVVAAEIDWKVKPKLLSQELKELGIEETSLPEQRVDFLIEVTTRGGERKVIFLHLEIQSHKEEGFAARIYRYYQTISAHAPHEVVTLVVLADSQRNWRPSRHEQELMGCRVVFEFPVCKLLDLLVEIKGTNKQAAGPNLALLAAQAQIAALRTAKNSKRRLKERLILFRQVLQVQGWKKHEVQQAFRVLSWMMKLPRTESLQFRETVANWREMKTTAPLTDIEELWLEEGIEKGIEKGITSGEWMGKVQLLETLLDRIPTESAVLRKETVRHLQARFHKLEKEYDKKHRR